MAPPRQTEGRTASCREQSRRGRPIAATTRRLDRQFCVWPQPGRRAVRCAASTAPRYSSRRKSVAPSTWGDRPQSASSFRCAHRQTRRARSSRWRPPRVRRPIHLQSRRFRSSSAVRHTGRCHGCRIVGSSPRRAWWRGYRYSPGTPFPRSRCHQCWCAEHTGSDRDRNAMPHRRRPQAAPADAASLPLGRPGFDSPGRIPRSALSLGACRADTTRPAPTRCHRCPACPLTMPPQSRRGATPAAAALHSRFLRICGPRMSVI